MLMNLHVLILASHVQEKSWSYTELRCTAKPGWALWVHLCRFQCFVKMTQWQMKVFAHPLEYCKMLLLCFTRVHANTYTTQYTQRWARRQWRTRDDTYKQPQTTQHHSSSVIPVTCLSLPQYHVSRLEHVNWAKRTRAKGGGGVVLCYTCTHLGRTDSNTPLVSFG